MSKNAFITGGNSGIGKEMARALAAQGYRVIIASRDQGKSQDAVNEIKSAQPTADIEAMSLDLGDFDHIDRFVPQLLEKMPVIDVLILNAGLYTQKLRKVKSGYEAMIGIMHFGHFRLVQQLLDAVEASEQGRIIVTSSVAHYAGRIRPESFTRPRKHLLPFSGYAQAKLANLLFARELARRVQGSNVTVNAFHPGGVATGIWTELPGPMPRLMDTIMISPEKGADTAIWLATSAEGGRYNGEYFVRRKLKAGSPASRDQKLARKLWDITEEAMQAGN